MILHFHCFFFRLGCCLQRVLNENINDWLMMVQKIEISVAREAFHAFMMRKRIVVNSKSVS